MGEKKPQTKTTEFRYYKTAQVPAPIQALTCWNQQAPNWKKIGLLLLSPQSSLVQHRQFCLQPLLRKSAFLAPCKHGHGNAGQTKEVRNSCFSPVSWRSSSSQVAAAMKAVLNCAKLSNSSKAANLVISQMQNLIFMKSIEVKTRA